MHAVTGWENFLVAEAGASAALTGLLFVSISINIAKILEYKSAVLRAAEALLLLLSVLLAATFALTPGQSDKALGIELLFTGLALCSVTLVFQMRGFESAQPVLRLASRVIFCQFAGVSYIICGTLLVAHHPAGMYWFLPACLAAFIGGVTSAWVLLIEILR